MLKIIEFSNNEIVRHDERQDLFNFTGGERR